MGGCGATKQHVSHRRTFFFLEHVILKHEAAARAIRITQMDQGIDFFFANRSHAVKFVEFLGKVVPVKSRTDKQLVSHDTKSNSYNYKHTFSVEICPICREDLICFPPKVSVGLGNIGPLVIYTKKLEYGGGVYEAIAQPCKSLLYQFSRASDALEITDEFESSQRIMIFWRMKAGFQSLQR
ncbi:hypothetical protein AgCh_030992 [Apium graveolens]